MTASSATMVAMTRVHARRRTVATGARYASIATVDVYDGVVGRADALVGLSRTERIGAKGHGPWQPAAG